MKNDIINNMKILSNLTQIYNVRYFFEFSGAEIAITGVALLLAPLFSFMLSPKLGLRYGKKKTAIGLALLRLILFPMPYVAVLLGLWPELQSPASIALYTTFVFVEVTAIVVSATMLDSMMADIVEDSEVKTSRRSEGLFYAARSFAGKFVSAFGIVLAGSIVSLVGMDGIKTITDMTDEMRVTVVATGLGDAEFERPKTVVDNTQRQPISQEAAVNYSDLDRPAVSRRKALETDDMIGRSQDMKYLDIPAFIRRQAD